MNDVKKPLEPSEMMRLRAVEGWLELGNPNEASEELSQIATRHQGHPDVMQARWHVNAKLQRWDACVEIGKAMVTLTPNKSLGWINYANALFYLKKYQEAFDILFPVVQRFPKNPYMRYNLACYQCQLGNHDVSMDWFKKAMDLGDAKELKRMALEDGDLKPVWKRIASL